LQCSEPNISSTRPNHTTEFKLHPRLPRDEHDAAAFENMRRRAQEQGGKREMRAVHSAGRSPADDSSNVSKVHAPFAFFCHLFSPRQQHPAHEFGFSDYLEESTGGE
jgi:hypothetical protein